MTRPFETARFGRIHPARSAQLTLKGGLVGFSTLSRFVVIEHPGRPEFAWLQSLDDGSLAFPVTDPRRHLPEVRYMFGSQDLAAVGLTPGTEPEVLVTVTVPPEGGIRLNLSGPIMVNPVRRLAKQLVLAPHVAPVCSSSPAAEAKAS